MFFQNNRSSAAPVLYSDAFATSIAEEIGVRISSKAAKTTAYNVGSSTTTSTTIKGIRKQKATKPPIGIVIEGGVAGFDVIFLSV